MDRCHRPHGPAQHLLNRDLVIYGAREPQLNARSRDRQQGNPEPCALRGSGTDFLQGDCTKAKQKLNWKPRVAFDELVREMVHADVELMRTNPNA
ncbi:hypothetical protein H8959_009690 [Pygathrix nigripes]